MVPFVDSALEIDFMVLLDLLVGERNFVTQNSKNVHAFLFLFWVLYYLIRVTFYNYLIIYQS